MQEGARAILMKFIYKTDNETYDIDFTRIGSYEKFLAENGDGAEGEGISDDDEE